MTMMGSESALSNEEIDRRTLEAIQIGHKHTRDILLYGSSYYGDSRVLDNSLRRLKKQGKIFYRGQESSLGWHAVATSLNVKVSQTVTS